MGLFEKQESFLGVDIGAHGIKVVELRKTKNRPQLWTYGIIDDMVDIHAPVGENKTIDTLRMGGGAPSEKKNTPQTLSPERLAQADRYAVLLKGLVKEAKLGTTHVTASLPVSYVFHTVITAPELPRQELAAHIEAKVAKVLPQPVSDMQIEHQIIPQSETEKKRRNMRILVTAAPAELIRFYTTVFQKAGLELQELETEAFALERALVGRDTATVMIVDVGAERTNFFIVDQGLPVTHRSIQMGGHSADTILTTRLGVTQGEVETVKRALSRLPSSTIPTDIFASFAQAVVKEIQYGFDLYLHQTGNQEKKPEKIILTGGGAQLPILQTEIARAFPMKVFIGDPWARVVYQQGLKRVLDELGPRMSVAIGLALRNIV